MRILISGAGVAGLAAGVVLEADGHDIAIVERAHQFRTKGAPIDIRGDAIAVADQMGILHELKARAVNMSEGARFVDHEGTPVSRLGGESFHESDDDIEVPREDICSVLESALDPSTALNFGDFIHTLVEDENGVDVAFDSGSSARFDIVVGADGLHSLTRRHTFGPEDAFVEHLGFYAAYTWFPSGTETEDSSSILTWPGHAIGTAYYKDTALGMLQFRSPVIDYDYHDIDEQRQILLNAFAGHSEWRLPAILDCVRHDPDLYFDSVSQVHLNTWHKGRIVLVGDAAHCASALSGRGTSLALTGAWHLAQALRDHPDDLDAAFGQYQVCQRPDVTRAQEMAIGAGDLLIPDTQAGIDARNEQWAVTGD